MAMRSSTGSFRSAWHRLYLYVALLIGSADAASEGDVHQLWATPVTILGANRQNVNAISKLKGKLLSMASTLPSDAKSNVGGWQYTGQSILHSEPDFSVAANLCQDAISSHLKKSVSGGGEFAVTISASWANVNPGGAYHRMHVHPQSDLSGVLYVSCPEEEVCGIDFIDPRPMASAQRSAQLHEALDFGVDKNVKMSAGEVVVFPSWLSHWVPPHWSELERISIAFNANVDFTPGTGPMKIHFRRGRQSGSRKTEL